MTQLSAGTREAYGMPSPTIEALEQQIEALRERVRRLEADLEFARDYIYDFLNPPHNG